MTQRTWTVVLVSLTMLAPAAVGAVSGDANTTAVPESPGDGRGLTNATIEVADILATNQTPDLEPNYSQLDAPPGLGADDPWVDANGDEMYGALEMGPNVIRLNGRPLSATLDGDLQFAGDNVCLQAASNCEGQSIAGQTPIVVEGSTVGMSTQGCADGEFWKWTGSTWDCQADLDTTYDGTDFALSDQSCASGEVVAGVDASGNIACVIDQDTDSDTLADLNCASTEITRYDGTAWTCSTDQDTTYNGSDFALSDQGCASGEVVAGVTADGSLVCVEDATTTTSSIDWSNVTDKPAGFADDVDNDTTYDGTDFALSDQSCASGEVVAGVDASGNVACVVDQDSDSDTLAELNCSSDEITRYDGTAWTCSTDQDTTYNGSDFALSDQSCPSGDVVAGVDASGNVVCVTDQDTDSDTLAELDCASTEITRYDGSAWICSTDQDTTYSAGDGLELDSTTFNLTQACASDEILKYDGSSWACSVDEAGASDVWLLGGNAGLTEGEDFLGTTDATNLTMKVNDSEGLRLLVAPNASNILGGAPENQVREGVEGAIVAGGGSADLEFMVRPCMTCQLEVQSFGPHLNNVTDDFGAIGGGAGNTVGDDDGTTGFDARFATVGGGWNNTASSKSSTVGGGSENVASGPHAAVGGGELNDASDRATTVGGGDSNTANENYATVSGGRLNTASDTFSTVSGGHNNTASDHSATVPGGDDNKAAGWYSLAAGAGATAGHDGTFVWSDSGSNSPDTFVSTGPDQFLIDASGGVGIGTTSPATALDVSGTVTATDADLGADAIDATEVDSTTVQERVTGSCSGGDAVESIAQDGSVSCVSTSTDAWLLGGNAGLTEGEDFLGTTDATNLTLKVNGTQAAAYVPTAGTPNVVSGNASNVVTADAQGAVIGGGGDHVASRSGTVVGGGVGNTASGTEATVAGGDGNTASDSDATVGGGAINTASGVSATVAGGEQNTASSAFAVVAGGNSNTASAFEATVAGGQDNEATGLQSSVGGGSGNTAKLDKGTTVAGGVDNRAGRDHVEICLNNKDDDSDGVVDERPCSPRASDATVGGGDANTASGPQSTVAGGTGNDAKWETGTTVAGGVDNRAGRDHMEICSNGVDDDRDADVDETECSPSSLYATVGGGTLNNATGLAGTVGGGERNWVNAPYATISGGGPTSGSSATSNTVYDKFGTIGGGGNNTAGSDTAFDHDAYGATVGGGIDNVASDSNATVAGGSDNTASGANATVGGGSSNTASGFNTTVGGGDRNTASALYATVGGGTDNTADGARATVGGGDSNTASGTKATVPGGDDNEASGFGSFAAGTGATAQHHGTFVWSDSTDPTPDAFASTGSDQFLIEAAGGVGIGTANPSAALDVAGDLQVRDGDVNADSADLRLQPDENFQDVIFGTGTTSTDSDVDVQVPDGGVCVDSDGECVAPADGEITAKTYNTGSSDLAEVYPSEDDLEPAEVVTLDGDEPGHFERTTEAGQEGPLRVVSTEPGLLLGVPTGEELAAAGMSEEADADSQTLPGTYPIALSGRVPVQATVENGPIEAGDPLTSSSVPGTAMKATGDQPVLGHALEPLDGPTGTVTVFVTPGEEVDDASTLEEALADQQQQIDQLESENEQLSQENQELRERLDAIEERLDRMEE